MPAAHAPKFSSTSTECVSRPPDIPERIPMRLRTSSGQPMISNDRLPIRNTPGTSSVRLPSSSVDKMSTSNYKSDFEVDRSPLLNHTVQMDKTQLAKARPRQLPSKRLSNPSIEDGHNQIEEPEIKVLNGKMSSTEHIGSELLYFQFSILKKFTFISFFAHKRNFDRKSTSNNYGGNQYQKKPTKYFTYCLF